MTFLSTWAFGFLGLIPVIVLLYLLKLKRRPVQVSTLLFWEKVLQENRRRALFQRLRQFLSLLLHLLIFLLILLALARPEWNRFVKTGASTVTIVDTRARMQASTAAGGDSRFESARNLLRGYARHASGDHQMALLASGASTRVVVPFTADERALRKGIDSLEASDATGTLESATALAGKLVKSRKGAHRIVVVTGDPDFAPTDDSVEVVRVSASDGDNVAITRFATRPLPASPETSQVMLEVRNFGSERATGNVEISFDGRILDVKPYALEPDETWFEVFPSVPADLPTSRGWLTARLDAKDALAVDNLAFAVLPPRRPTRVLLVSEGNWFIERMLQANDLVEFEILTPDAFNVSIASSFDAVILDRTMPGGYELATTPGNFLFIKETPFNVPGAAPLSAPLVTERDTASPLLRLTDLRNVSFLRASALALPEEISGDWRFGVPLNAFDGPLIATGTRTRDGGGEQRLAAFAFDVAESDLPLRVAFPLLMANTLQWLGGNAAAAPLSVQAGSAVRLNPGEKVWTVPQRVFDYELPDIAPEEFAVDEFTPTRNGFYLLRGESGDRWIAVNTFSATEADLGTRETATSEVARTVRFPGAAVITAWPLWVYLALAALLLFTLEWWLFHRRRTE
jgi:hypothetical protein